MTSDVKPVRARRGRVLKWLAIGTVAFFGLIFLSGLTALRYLSPVLSFDEKSGRIVALGGLIELDEELNQMHLGNMQLPRGLQQESTEYSGEQELSPGRVEKIRVPFNTAKLEVTGTNEKAVRWKCRSMGAGPQPTIAAGVLNFNLDGLNLAKCSIAIPLGLVAEFVGINGQLNVKDPSDSMTISLVNGKVNIQLDPTLVYDVDVNVKNGLADFFPRSSDKKAIKLSVDVVNGLVKQDL